VLPIDTNRLFHFFEITPHSGRTPARGIFVLGAAQSVRYTVLSQQVRAIYLIEALFAAGRATRGSAIGIVGAGVAGATAACAALDRGARVTIFERNSSVLTLFGAASHRYLHPHLYNWPNDGWDNPHAGLPYMTWSFDVASTIAKTLKAQFGAVELQYSDRISIHLNCESLVFPNPNVPEIVDQWGTFHTFDHLIVAVGPGREIKLGSSPLYWETDTVSRSHDVVTNFYVLGVGDGGLIDALRIRLARFNERTIVDEFFEYWDRDERDRTERAIAAFEGARGTRRDPIEIDKEYADIADNSPHAREWLRKRLRTDTTLTLIGRQHRLMAAVASPLNRFFMACLRAVKDPRFKYVRGLDSYSEATIATACSQDVIPLHDGGQLSCKIPWQLVLRLGPIPELPRLSQTLTKLAEGLSHVEQLDVFGSYVKGAWDRPADRSFDAFTPSSSSWTESQFPAASILTTRFSRYDKRTGALIRENEQRGEGFDIGDHYFDRRPMRLLDALAVHERVFIIGSYGSGKSHAIDRLCADAQDAYYNHASASLAARYAQWNSKLNSRPFPARFSALRFALWIWRAPRDAYALWKYVAMEVCALGTLDAFISECRQHGLCLVIEQWSEVPLDHATYGIAGRSAIAHSIALALDAFRSLGITLKLVITAAYEPATQAPRRDATHEQSLLAPFERFVVAPLSHTQQNALIHAFCSERGWTAHEFMSSLTEEQQTWVARVATTPGRLKQLLELWLHSGRQLDADIDAIGLYRRFVADYFRDDASASAYVGMGAFAQQLRRVLTRLYARTPACTRVVFHQDDVLPSVPVASIQSMLKAGRLVQHGRRRYSVADAHIQDFLIGWGISMGDHLHVAKEDAQKPAGESMLIRLWRMAEEWNELMLELPHALSPHSIPLLIAMELEVDRADKEYHTATLWQQSVASVVTQFFTSLTNPELPLIAARAIADNPTVATLIRSSIGRREATEWSKILCQLIPAELQRKLTPREHWDIGRALDAICEPRTGVTIGRNATPDVDWIKVAGGTIECGATERDRSMYAATHATPPDDEPRRPVTLPDFEISRYTVSNAQFRLFMEDYLCGYYSNRPWNTLQGPLDARDSVCDGQLNCPVAGITWDEAQAFAHWLSLITGDEICLPTSDEWEFAARSGQVDAVFGAGTELRYGEANCQEEGLPGPIAVGMFPASNSPLGIADLSGNVFEWCSDSYSAEEPDFKLTKGGSYNHGRLRCRLAVRGRKRRDAMDPYIGFRLCRRQRCQVVRPRIVIVGAGFAGVCTAIRLMGRVTEPIDIVLVERDPAFYCGGLAYHSVPGRETWEHLFNLQAGRISMFREDRSDFIKWLNSPGIRKKSWASALGAPCDDSSAVPRCLYHYYLVDRLADAQVGVQQDVVLRGVFAKAVSTDEERREIELLYHDHIPIALGCNQAIVTTGNLQVKHLAPNLPGAGRYIDDQYGPVAREALARIKAGDRVLVIGTQLRAFDVVMTLRAQLSDNVRDDIDIVLVSRGGRTHKTYPATHMHGVVDLPEPAFLNKPQLTREEVVEGVKVAYREAWRRLHDSISVAIRGERILKAWERFVPKLIAKLPRRDVTMLLNRWGSLITTARIGVVPAIGDVVRAEWRKGRLSVLKSGIHAIDIRESDGRLRVVFGAGDGDEHIFDWVVNCMGREKDYRTVSDLLWKRLIGSGVGRAHWTNVGVDVDWQGMLVGRDGKASEWLSAVGVMREGVELVRYGRLGSFAFTLGPIKNQALEAATYVLRRIERRQIKEVVNSRLQGLVAAPGWTRGDEGMKALKEIWVAAVDIAGGQEWSGRDSSLFVKRIMEPPELGVRVVNACMNSLTCRSVEDARKAKKSLETLCEELGRIVNSVRAVTDSEALRFVADAMLCIEEAALLHLVRLDVVQPDLFMSDDNVKVGHGH
jgi:formylglycine-generating enzyme required for sulfatase activity/uncharacterized NAD(P)/FAD-binding protein YdhS